MVCKGIEWMMLCLISEEHYPKGIYSKLHVRKNEPCMINMKFGNNTYELENQGALDISTIFSVNCHHDWRL